MADLPKVVGVLAKTETVRLTDAAPTPAANAIRILNTPRPQPTFLEPNLREGMITGRLGRGIRAAAGGRAMTVELMVEARALGVAYTAGTFVDYDPLLLACGLARTFESPAGSEAQAYATAETAQTCTLWLYSYTKRFKLVGCVGTARWSLRAGAVPTITFTMTGVLREDPTDLALPVLTLSNTIGPIFGSATTTIDALGFAGGLRVESMEWDLANQIAPLPAAGAQDGHDGYEISDRAPTLAMVIRSVSLATYNAITGARQGTQSVDALWGSPGTPNYNALQLIGPAWQPALPEFADRDGIGTLSLSGPLGHAANGDRDFTFKTR